VSDSFAIVRRGISIEYIRASRRDAALAALDSIEAENERLRQALVGLKFNHDCWCVDPDSPEGHELACKETNAALARIPVSKEP